MKNSKMVCLLLVLAVCLTGCSKGTPVYVQQVSDLAVMGGIAPGDRFAGLVVSENVAEIHKDGDRTIAELLVKEGDDVKEGQALFSYDTEELQLTLDKQKLELEQMNASVENYKQQIEDLENQSRWLRGSAKLQYTIQIQTLQVDLKEAELKIKSKEAEIVRSEDILANATVLSPVTGRIQAISENGTDNMGNPLPYITIQQAGSYRVKGILGELQRGGITEGVRLKIGSRTDDSLCWYGTVSLVDYENPSQGSDYEMYYGNSADEMTAASRYPFYVELENTDGLILGQHVYMELAAEEDTPAGPAIDMSFVCYEEDGETAYVWAEKGSRLEKRTITLGEINPMTGTVEIVEGLTEDDYIAFPDPSLCVEGAPTTHEFVAPEEPEADMVAEGGVV